MGDGGVMKTALECLSILLLFALAVTAGCVYVMWRLLRKFWCRIL